MRLLNKLLTYIYDGINHDADGRPAIVLKTNDETMRVEFLELAMVISSQNFDTLTYELTGLTISNLAAQLGYSGYFLQVSVNYDAYANFSARTLVYADCHADDSGFYQFELNLYRSMLWVILDMFSLALETAKADIMEMLKQLYLHSAEAYWLEEWGSYFGERRQTGETDSAYLQRMIANILKPKCNNKALEILLFEKFGKDLSVTDCIDPQRVYHKANGIYKANGEITALGYEVVNAGTTLFKLPDMVERIYHYADGTYQADGAINSKGYHDVDLGILTAEEKQQVFDFINQVKAAGTALKTDQRYDETGGLLEEPINIYW